MHKKSYDFKGINKELTIQGHGSEIAPGASILNTVATNLIQPLTAA
jgi:hypothetical protein